MDNQPIITVNNLSKTFKLPHEKQSSLKSLVTGLGRNKRTFEVQQALKGVSFEVKEGEFFGIVGRNGSGKSTLLKLLAGIYTPTSGSVKVEGSLTPFIELGVGFNPELTGRENVYLNGALLGFNRSEMSAMYKDIVDFAELENFMDQKLKNYSSGMQVRLAFSIAIKAESDILLIDEVLAVGDVVFQQKCFSYFERLKRESRTVVFVSHDRGALERFCDRGILIENGKEVYSGEISSILERYDQSNVDREDIEGNPIGVDKTDNNGIRNKQPAQITKTETLNSEKKARTAFLSGEPILLRFQVAFNEEIKNPVFGVTINNIAVDVPLLATNTLIEGQRQTGIFKKGTKATVELPISLLLNNGVYTIAPAVANENGGIIYHNPRRASTFKVLSSKNPYSLLSAREKIKIS